MQKEGDNIYSGTIIVGRHNSQGDLLQGLCRKVKTELAVRVISTGKILTGIDIENLQHVEKFTPDSYVALDSLIGSIQSVKESLHVSFSDGSRCIISKDDGDYFDDYDDSNYYFPGQILIGSASYLKNANWISGGKKIKKLKGNKIVRMLVENVVTDSVDVIWQYSLNQEDITKFPRKIEGADLERLKLFENTPTYAEQGAVFLYNVRDDDEFLTKSVWRCQKEEIDVPYEVCDKKNSKKQEDWNIKKEKIDSKSEKSKKDSEKQETEDKSSKDGISDDSSKKQKPPMRRPSLQTKRLKRKPLTRTRQKRPRIAVQPNSPAVVKILMHSSYADVAWEDGTIEYGIPVRNLNADYDHDMELFFPGDMVLQNKPQDIDNGAIYGVVQSANSKDRVVTISWYRQYIPPQEDCPILLETNEMSVYDVRKHTDDYGLYSIAVRIAGSPDDGACNVGEIQFMCQKGFVHVRWANGEKSKVWPQELYLLKDLYDDVEFSNDWSESSEDDDEEEEIAEKKTPSKVSKICAKAWSGFKNRLHRVLGGSSSKHEAKSEDDSMVDDSSLKQIQDGVFELLSSPSANHKFKQTPCVPPNKRFLQTVRKEMNLLRSSLPPGIWVKGYEERMDLYTTMIQGPEKTPYEDCLFIFDIQLPSNYPQSPPTFHYHAYCSDRLNPNLYEDGKVCVSLLGTWTGRDTEKWTTDSTLLQVLVSIQGLILVKEPYFNEPGYDNEMNTKEGYDRSRQYNETAVAKSFQALTALCHNPYTDFENEIKEHVSERAGKIIERFEKWLDMADNPPTRLFGQPAAADEPDFPLLPASRGFRVSVRKTLDSFKKLSFEEK